MKLTTTHTRHALSATVLSLAVASCVGEEAYCGGFEQTVIVDVMVQRLTLDIDDTRPVQAEICPLLPRECPCVQTDAMGHLRAPLPANSEVMVEIRAPRFKTTIGTTTTGTTDRLASLRVIDSTTINVLASVIDEDLDVTRGHIGLRVSPAEGASVAGTTFTLTHLGTGDSYGLVYTVDGIPDREATGTDASGVAIAVNLAPGRYRLASPTLSTCAVADAGWPQYDAMGRIESLEFEVRADAVTLLDALRCAGTS